MFGPTRAIAIDDELTDLLAITTGLSACGIPCIGCWYDRETHSLKPSVPREDLTAVRLVFMDLNLEEFGGIPAPANLVGPVMEVLKQIISQNGGPYAVVFWTMVGVKVDEVRQLLYERLDGIPHPVAVVELPKAEFAVAKPTEQDFKPALKEFYLGVMANLERLKEEVKRVAAIDSRLFAVSMWEGRASEAAAGSVNAIHACAERDATDKSKSAESLGNILAKIAIEATGKKVAVHSPARALDAGMIDILKDQFGSSVVSDAYQKAIATAIGGIVGNELDFTDRDALYADLNTLFQVDLNVDATIANERGVVVSANGWNQGELGFNKVIIFDEFVQPNDAFPPEEREEILGLYREFRSAAEFVLIELGADCDHAQDSSRTQRYLVGIEVPPRYFRLLYYPNSRKLRSDGLVLFGPWKIGKATQHLLVSSGRFWVNQKKEPPPKAAVKYRLREPVVNKLLHHYASYSGRPGIIDFR